MRKNIFSSCHAVLAMALILLLSYTSASAQMPQRAASQVTVVGWIDDTHFLLRTFDSNNAPVIKSVDARTGRSTITVQKKTGRELFMEAVPGNIQVGPGDLLSPDYNSAVINKDNDLYYLRKGAAELIRITNGKDPEVNVRYSPESGKIAYTRNKDLYVFDFTLMRELRLTDDASDRIYNGYASWVYMEEILGRASRYAAFWWSPDGTKIAYLRTDETEVPVFTLNRLDEPDGVHGTLEVVPYPKAGDPNPKVKIGIADLGTTKTTWVKTDYSIDQYIAWPFWTPDSRKLAVQVLDRDQTELRIILASAESGDYEQIYRESRPTWVEFREDIYVLGNGTGFIIRSFKNDWENLYYYDWTGKLIAQLTDLNFRVTSLDRVDESAKLVYFSATGTESTDSHGFRVGLDGRNLIQISKGEGTHSLNISPKGSYITDTWNSITSTGSILLYDKKGKLIREVHRFDQPAYDPAKHPKAELVKIRTSDGLFEMPAIITYPLNFNPAGKYPVVFTVYGGPDSKNVNNRWQGTNASWYAQNNIITFTVDHRGSGQFGKKGLDYMHRSLGKWELLDYADAVKWLREKPYVDVTKIGITGTSYGGYLACLALTRGAGYWTHAVAGMPVTDYRLYDNVYTERYMDKPQDNPEGYRDGSALTFASRLQGELYIYHADMDDNVHMQNSIYLISRLQDEGKTFRFMLYPNGRHGWGGPKAAHVRNETYNFWLDSFFK